MKIVVLAGGISTEREKGIRSSWLICFSDCPVSMDILKNCLIPR